MSTNVTVLRFNYPYLLSWRRLGSSNRVRVDKTSVGFLLFRHIRRYCRSDSGLLHTFQGDALAERQQAPPLSSHHKHLLRELACLLYQTES